MSNNSTLIEINTTEQRRKAVELLNKAKSIESKQDKRKLRKVAVLNGVVLTNNPSRWQGYEPYKQNGI